MEKLEFKSSNNREVIARLKSGKICFPDKKGLSPKAGELWECEVHEPTGKKVAFATLVRKCKTTSEIDAETIRENAAVVAAHPEWDRLAQLFPELSPRIDSWGDLRIDLFKSREITRLFDRQGVEGGSICKFVYNPRFNFFEVIEHLRKIEDSIPFIKEYYEEIRPHEIGGVEMKKEGGGLYVYLNYYKYTYNRIFPLTVEGIRGIRIRVFGSPEPRLSKDKLFEKFKETKGLLEFKGWEEDTNEGRSLVVDKPRYSTSIEASYRLNGYKLTEDEVKYLISREKETIPAGFYRPADAYEVKIGKGVVGALLPIPPVKGDGWVVVYQGKTGNSRRGVSPEGETFRGVLGVDAIRQPGSWDWQVFINGTLINLRDHRYSGAGFIERCQHLWGASEGKILRSLLSEEEILRYLADDSLPNGRLSEAKAIADRYL